MQATRYALICAGEFDTEALADWQEREFGETIKNNKQARDNGYQARWIQNVKYNIEDLISEHLIDYLDNVLKTEYGTIFDTDTSASSDRYDDRGQDVWGKPSDYSWVSDKDHDGRTPVSISNDQVSTHGANGKALELEFGKKDLFVSDTEVNFVLSFIAPDGLDDEILATLTDAFQGALDDFVNDEGIRDVFPDGIVCDVESYWKGVKVNPNALTQTRRSRR